MKGMRLSPAVFMIVYSIAYAVLLARDWPLFRYYPLERTVSWGTQIVTDRGPHMAWYGLMAGAAIIALPLALLLHARDGARWVQHAWVFPGAALLVVVFVMREWFY